MKWNQHRQTQRKKHWERRREGAGGRGCPKRIARAAVMLSFFILSPISLWPASFSFSRSAFSYFFGLLQTKQNAKQTYFLYTERERGEGGRQRGRANTFVCKYEKFKAHTLSVLKHALIQTHIHTHMPALPHTHASTHSHSHTHTFVDAHMSATWCCFQFKLHFLLLPLLLRRGYSYFHTRWSRHLNPHAYKVLYANYIQCFMATRLDFIYIV